MLLPRALWAWIEVMAPVFYLHSAERYFPCDFNRYVNRCRLKNVATQTVFRPDTAMTAEMLGRWLDDYPDLTRERHTLVLLHGLDDPLVEERPTGEAWGQIPLYVHVVQRGPYDFLVSYIHMYAYNGPLACAGGLFHAGAHFADKEHVTLHLSFGRHQTLRQRPDLVRAYFSRHAGGVWIRNQRLWPSQNDGHSQGGQGPDEIEMTTSSSCYFRGGAESGGGARSDDGSEAPATGEDDLEFDAATGRLVVYSALHSHASYNRAGRHSRFWGLCPDRCDRGHRWHSRALVDLTSPATLSPDLRWTALFRGFLGDGHVASLTEPRWWTEEEETENYGQKMCFPCSS